MEELQEITCEVGMKYVTYPQHFRSPDEELFSFGMKNQILQSALGSWYGTLVSVLASVVNWPIVSVATITTDLSETEGIHHKGNTWVENQENKKGFY